MSKLKDGMLLYHGSYTAVKKIDFARCSNAKDFGKGFYLTSDENQAKSFIRQSIRKAVKAGDVSAEHNFGFVSAFRYHMPEDSIKTYEFHTTDREWLWFVAQNRRENLANKLRPKLDEKILKSEIIIGKIANDRTNMTIAAYLNGLYGDIESDEAVDDTVKRLMPEKLQDQFCFLTEEAIKCLIFEETIRYDI